MVFEEVSDGVCDPVIDGDSEEAYTWRIIENYYESWIQAYDGYS